MDKEFSLFDYYTLTKNPQVLICYRGPVTDIILREISKDIRLKLSQDIQISRKVFAIYMEMAQNILYYSCEKINLAKRQDSIGTILLTQNADYYIFSCGNLIEKRFLKEIIHNCEIINSLDREALREYKREQRSATRKERSRGAGIGLIQVALTSRNPISIEYKDIDKKYALFSLSTKIAKAEIDRRAN